jgi:hypothetical protein
MKACKRVGLVGAGGVNQSFLARMPALLGLLGPVKGSTLRVSRRIANGLRAGFAAGDYGELQPCEFIWIFAPEDTLDRVAADLAAEVAMQGKMVVLCDVLRDSLGPSPLRTAGARLATVNCVPESDEQVFVAEGHPAVIAALRKQLAVEGRKLIELRPAAKTLYLSGAHMGAHLLMPWIAGAVESFRAAGFSRSEAARVVQALGARALRGYEKAGVRSWSQADAERLYQAIEADMDAIRLTDHRLAALYTDGAEPLLRLFSKPCSQETRGKRLTKVATRKAS